jgi:hypothetical protein
MSDATEGRAGSSTPSTPQPLYADASYADDSGDSWVMFAAIMLALVATLNMIYGIAAIDNANFFVADQQYILSDLNTWGWVMLVVGGLQMIAAFSIWSGGSFGRWFGIAVASLNAIAALLSIPAYPFWSLAVFAIDILIIYGLATYGGGRRADA